MARTSKRRSAREAFDVLSDLPAYAERVVALAALAAVRRGKALQPIPVQSAEHGWPLRADILFDQQMAVRTVGVVGGLLPPA
jgi:hypothetical protein